MNVLIATDKFKGTLSAIQVCDAIERGFLKSGVSSTIRKFPLADGGDGTLDIFLWHLKGELVEVEVHDPLMRKRISSYGLSQDSSIAFIEMAKASGLELLKPAERDPLKTTTFGTGELIRDALSREVKSLVLGVGGSATNDAGLGAAAALGIQALDDSGNLLFPRGEVLKNINRLDMRHLHPRVHEVAITAICDVTNPFFGEEGAAFVYAPQKGAAGKDVLELDTGLQQVAKVIQRQFGIDLQTLPGAGAGGGFAGGIHALLGASLQPGTKVVFDMIDFDAALKWADVIITGEGKVDQQTLQGKLVSGVSHRAFNSGKKVVVVCGHSELSQPELKELHVQSLHSLTAFAGKEAAMDRTSFVLEDLVCTELVHHL